MCRVRRCIPIALPCEGTFYDNNSPLAHALAESTGEEIISSIGREAEGVCIHAKSKHFERDTPAVIVLPH